MTLLDLYRLIRRHWTLAVVLPILCAVACFGYFSLAQDQTYTATARIVVNSQVQSVAGLAASEARQAAASHPGVSVEAKGDTATYTVTVTAKAANAEECLVVVNEVAESAEQMAERFYRGKENPYEGHVEKALSADASAGGKMKYTLVALLAGLFVAICIVVLIDMVRRPVKSIEGVQDAAELPVLEKLPVADGGERLLANVRFASKKDDLQSVCVVPVSDALLSEEVCDLLAEAVRSEGVEVSKVNAGKFGDIDPEGAGFLAVSCGAFTQGMAGAYAARRAGAVVLAVRQWSDSLTSLESSVAELKLADVNLVGIVFAPEKK